MKHVDCMLVGFVATGNPNYKRGIRYTFKEWTLGEDSDVETFEEFENAIRANDHMKKLDMVHTKNHEFFHL